MKKEVGIKSDGKRMPPIDEEVVALVETESQHHCKVVFAHRVDPKGDAVGYGLCGWNIPRVKYWLDAELPNMDEEDADDQRKRKSETETAKWFARGLSTRTRMLSETSQDSTDSATVSTASHTKSSNDFPIIISNS